MKTIRGDRTNHKKGIAKAKKAQKRKEAEERNAAYASKSNYEKLKSAGPKERAKILVKD